MTLTRREAVTERRTAILRAIEQRPTTGDVSTRWIASVVGRPIDEVRRDLNALEAEGFVEGDHYHSNETWWR